MRYFIEDTLYPSTTPILIRWPDNKPAERYNYNSRSWEVYDEGVYIICHGDLLADEVTEKEIREVIDNAK